MEPFLTLFVFVISFGIFAVWPVSGLTALSFGLPFIGWSFYFKGLELPLADLIGLTVFIAFLARYLIDRILKRNVLPTWRWPLFLPFAFFIFFCLFSAVLSSNIGESLWHVFRWPIFLYLVYIFLPYNLINDSKDLKTAVTALIGSVSLVAISGYLSLFTQNWHDSFYRLSAISLFGSNPFGSNHNLIAEYLNVGAFLILMMRALSRSEKHRRIFMASFVFVSIGVLLTFSRAGWITLFLQILAYLIIGWKNKKKNILTILLGSSLVLLLFIPFAWRMGSLQANNTSSTENRWLLSEIAWKAFLDKPLFGQGSGQFVDLVSNNLRFTAKYGEPVDSHGFLQKIISENGAFGLGSWLFIIIVLIQWSARSLRNFPASRHWLLPLIIAGAGGLFFQIFNTSYYKGKVWLPIALGLAAIKLINERDSRPSMYEKNR